MGNWTSSKSTTYFNHRIVGDAKFFPASGEGENKKYAATFLTIVDGTKGGVDIFVDAKVMRGAERLAGLKKGQEVTVVGRVEFALDKNGKLRGKIWDAHVEVGQAVRDAMKASASEAAAPPPAEDPAPADDGAAPAFE